MSKEVQIYADMLSQPSRAVIWFCKLNNIPHKIHLVQIAKGENRTEEHKKRSPFKKVPSIEYDGFDLTESHAIIRYLNAKFNIKNQWYPENLEHRADVDEYLDWHHTSVRNCKFIIFAKVIAPMMGLILPDGFYEKAVKDANAALNDVERIWLEEDPYLTGDVPTVADLSCFCEIAQLDMADFDFTKGRPKLTAWFNKMKQVPGYEEVSATLHKVIAARRRNAQPKL